MKKTSRKLNIVFAVMLAFAMLIPLLQGAVSVNAAEAAESSEKKTVVVGYFDDDNDGFLSGFSDNDRKSGFAYEYLQNIARITGWNYEYVYGSWNELYTLLLEGKIDLMPGVGYDTVRAKKVLFSDNSIITMSYHVYADEKQGIDEDKTETLNGLRIAVRKNSAQYTLFKRFVAVEGVDCTIVTLSTEAACREALAAGKVDAYVSSTTHEHDGYISYFDIGQSYCYMAFAQGRDELLKEFNSAQKIIYDQTPYYNYILEEKYFHEYSSGSVLTGEQEEWLAQKGSLSIGITKNDLPFSAVDEEGNPTGVAAEIINALADYLKIPINMYVFDSTATLEKAVVNSDVDMAFPMYCDFWCAEKGGYLISNSIIEERAVIVYTGEFNIEKMKTVAVSTSSVSNRYLVDLYYSDAEKKIYSTRKEYLQAILDGEAGFTVGSSSVINRFIEENPQFHALNTALLSTDLEFGIGVSPNNHVLVGILNKAINNIDDSDITNALIKYSVVEKKATFTNFVRENTLTFTLSVLVAFFMVLVAVLIVRNRIILHKKTIEKQGKELDETQANLARALANQNVIYSELLRMESGGVVAVDWKTRKILTVNEAALRIFGFENEKEALSQTSDVLVERIMEEARVGKAELIKNSLKEKGSCVFEAPILMDNGSISYYLQQSVLRELANGQQVCLISLTDITESKELEMELQTASRIDALSCVYNRGWGEKLINDATEKGKGGMFCLLDINKFKHINDNFGHQCGDKAIKAVASNLKISFREQDIIMRLGGDEFAVFALGVHSKEEGEAIITRFFNNLAEDKLPEMEGKSINVALGACICHENGRTSFDDMYRMADSQMYKCKEKLESSFIFF